MEIREEVVKHHLVLHIDGDMDTNTSPEVESYMDELLKKDVRNIILNFKKLKFISSAGLRILLLFAKRTKGISGSLRICEPNGDVKTVFDISGFDSILDIYSTEDEALRAV
jgi:anti-anti-sigma factor